MDVRFDNECGTLVWTLPPEAADQLADQTPEVRAKILDAFTADVSLLCLGLLKTFGDEDRLIAMNAVMAQLAMIVNR